jgi:FkbM family methyltransferase
VLKKTIKHLAKVCGYEVIKQPRAYAAQRSLKGLLDQQRINVVLDIGANEGQFAEDLRASGYSGRIISFEPLAAAHKLLTKKAAADPNWTIAERTALGSETGSLEMHIAGNSMSSSLLPMLPAHSDAAPESKYIAVEKVPVNRLDNLWNASETDRILLKIDVQGYEKQVLDGAQQVLRNSGAVMIEMSFVALYDGQILAQELWHYLSEQGFEAWSLEPGFRHPVTARVLQCDGTFIRVYQTQ